MFLLAVLDCPSFMRRDSGGVFCEPCGCDLRGSLSCDMNDGTCNCRENVVGSNCTDCAQGLFRANGRLDGCAACDCVAGRTLSTTCDQRTGICHCEPEFGGPRCEHCGSGFYDNDGTCTPCGCSTEGSLSPNCHILTGQCDCKTQSTGRTCSECPDGYFVPYASYVQCVAPTPGQRCQSEYFLCNLFFFQVCLWLLEVISYYVVFLLSAFFHSLHDLYEKSEHCQLDRILLASIVTLCVVIFAGHLV